MCGIFCALSPKRHVKPTQETEELLRRRGPDRANTIHLRHRVQKPTDTDDDSKYDAWHIAFTSTVLSLRGSDVVGQPYHDEKLDAVLCWNGEAWSIDGASPSGNDTAAIFNLLMRATASGSGDAVTSSLSTRLSTVAGPYSFVFYSALTERLYFGRDFLGRRSLLWKTNEEGEFLLSSVTSAQANETWAEVEADGIYCVDLASAANRSQTDAACQDFGGFRVARIPYEFVDDILTHRSTSVIPRLSLNRAISALPTEQIDETSASVSMLEDHLRRSLALRVLNIPSPPLVHSRQSTISTSKLAVLFSGGLDCSVLARLLHDLLPLSEPIDLLNVAFENPRIHKTNDVEKPSTSPVYELCPDRITGRASFAELCRVCPARDWRFMAIDVPYSETSQHRQNVITLMHPHNTEMDLSIAYAHYFASRGTGDVTSALNGETMHCTTSARVLLSGLGADELFAGYTRHATAFNRRGYTGLLAELDLDVGRLGKRNLGRDDRVISTWGREARFPYLDEELVKWALATEVTQKCSFGEHQVEGSSSEKPAGSIGLEPGKKVLRCLAWKLGMTGVAAERKRAIQFGARTAKMETGKTKGTTLLS